MDMQNTNNSGSHPNRPMLKKVKRPINRMAPQSPAVSQQTTTQPPISPARPLPQETVSVTESTREPAEAPQAAGNPFKQQSLAKGASTGFSDDVFNIDKLLDGKENLPTVKNTPDTYRSPSQFIEEEDDIADDYEGSSNLPAFLNKKVLVLIGCVIFFLGFLTSKLLFTEQKVVRNGLQGVVVNPEVPRGRARCGVAERTQGCVLYLMNPQRQELNARDFYDLASQLTGRQRFVIETGNMRYSNTKIRPGDIVQLNIPPL